MKTLKIINIFFCIAIICMAAECRKDTPPELPPETQKGAGTFGCYVDGELFTPSVPSAFSFMLAVTADYYPDDQHPESNHLRIKCAADQAKFGHIELYIHNPREKESTTISRGYLKLKTPTKGYSEFACHDAGKIFITKLDTVNRIVSGTFEFPGRSAEYYFRSDSIAYVGESIVQITDGRFDLELSIRR